MRRLLRLLLPAFLSVAPIEGALAACSGVFQSQPDIAPGFMVYGSYDPGNPAPTTISTTFTIVPAQGMSPPCSIYVVVAPPKGMMDAGWTRTLTYQFGGNIATAVSPSTTSAFSIPLQTGVNQTFTSSITIPPKQNHPPQPFTEYVDLRIYSNQNQLLRYIQFQVSALVTGSCILPSPALAQLNFSGGIVTGAVSNGYTLSTSIAGASCSGAARMILRGVPMKTGALPTAQFDNLIHYRATAKLGSAAAVLSTDTASEAVVALPPTSGLMAVDVSLVGKGRPLNAGTYSSVLTVLLEPAN